MANARRGRDQRLVSRCRVEFDRPSGVVEAETEDLSVRGLFIRTEALLPVGEESEIRLVLPDGTLLGIRGRVAHMLTPSAARALGRHPGMGFELVGDDTASKLKLRAHIESLRTEITSPGLNTTTQAIVVEPSPPLRARMARCLESAGFKVTPCASATDALETCTQWRPDVIVCAAIMDGMSGIDLAMRSLAILAVLVVAISERYPLAIDPDSVPETNLAKSIRFLPSQKSRCRSARPTAWRRPPGRVRRRSSAGRPEEHPLRRAPSHFSGYIRRTARSCTRASESRQVPALRSQC